MFEVSESEVKPVKQVCDAIRWSTQIVCSNQCKPYFILNYGHMPISALPCKSKVHHVIGLLLLTAGGAEVCRRDMASHRAGNNTRRHQHQPAAAHRPGRVHLPQVRLATAGMLPTA